MPSKGLAGFIKISALVISTTLDELELRTEGETDPIGEGDNGTVAAQPQRGPKTSK
jgi:hypothetical protein